VTDRRGPLVAVLADDLIWATRLASIVTAAGGRPETVRTATAFAAIVGRTDAAIVDLGLRDGRAAAAIAAATAILRPVVAVGPHEASAARTAARAAGASHVYAYRKLFEDGPRTIAAWLGSLAPDPGRDPGPAADVDPVLDQPAADHPPAVSTRVR
jgi:hypothetical protein